METVEDVRVFFLELVDKYNLNFHPDTPFEDFDVLTGAQARSLNKKMAQSFEICQRKNADIYEIGLKILKTRLRKKSGRS